MAFQSKWGNAPLAGLPAQGPGLQEQALKWGANKALTAGINAAIPGGGIAAEGAQQFLPGVLGLANGGPVGGPSWFDYVGNRGNWREGGEGRKEDWNEAKDRFIKDYLASQRAPTAEEPVAPAPKPKPQPKPEQAGGWGVDVNDIGLGNLGGWDLSASGSAGHGGRRSAEIKGTRGFDFNRLLGAGPLGGRSSGSQGGTPFQEREIGSAISNVPPHLQQAAQQQAAPAAEANPLQPYLDAGISPEQAQFLLDAGAPPPSALKKGGEVKKPKGKKGWWQQAYDYAVGTGRAGEDSANFLKGKGLPQYKEMGGMIPSYTPGPLGMKDMVSMSKDIGTGPLAGVKYKKQGGEIVDEVEVKFHGPKTPSSKE